MKRGRIFVGGIGGRGAKGAAAGYPKPLPGVRLIPVWSRGRQDIISGQDLSPMKLGPVLNNDGTVLAYIFENFWQFQKIYPFVARQQQKHWKWPYQIHARYVSNEQRFLVDSDWFQWRRAGFASKKGIRRPNGTVKKNGPPLFSYFRGERLNYIQARKRIYCTEYKKLARTVLAYQNLLEIVRSGQDVLLIEPDGPAPITAPNGIEVTKEVIEQRINDPSQIYGHGFVLAESILEDLGEIKKDEFSD